MSDVERLASLFIRLSRRVEEVANQPRLIAASIPADSSIDVVDPETGQPVMSIGEQHDGTVGAYPITGPVPPVPSTPIVQDGYGVVVVTYDGRMASEADRFPMDGEHIEVWAAPAGDVPDEVPDPDTEPVPDEGDDPDDPTPPEPVPDPDDLPEPELGAPELVGALPAAGGTLTVPRRPGTWAITLRTRTLPGLRSAPSAAAFAVALPIADLSIDEDARRRNAEVAEELAEAQESWQRTVTETIPAVQSGVESVAALLGRIREQVGHKVWVWTGGEPFTVRAHDQAGQPTGPEFLRVEPLGDGQVRFVALLQGPHTGWGVGAASNLADGPSYVHTFTPQVPGTHWVRVTSNGTLHQAPVDITGVMFGEMEGDLGEWHDIEWPDVDWSQAQIALDQLTGPGGPLNPDAIAGLWEQVVAAGFLVATEAIIGPNVIAEEAVQAQHVKASESMSAKLAEFLTVTTGMLNVVTEDSSGAKVAVTDDGVRMWRAGNDGPHPNIALTTSDGFRVMLDDGTSVLWVDLATGTVHTDGAVLSNTTISAPEVTGGIFAAGTFRTGTTGRRVQIDPAGGLRAWNDANLPTLSMDPTGGVVIGGGGTLYDAPTPWTTTSDQAWITDAVPVVEGSTYGLRFRLQATPGFPSDSHYVEAVYTVGTAEHSALITTHGHLMPIGSDAGLLEGNVVAQHTGTLRLRYRRGDTPTPPAGHYVQISDVQVTAVPSGTVDVGDLVRAPRGAFTVAELHSIKGSSGVEWDPSDTGWLPFDLQSNWIESAGWPPQRRKRGDMVYLRGEVRAVASTSQSIITRLPVGWRPAQRVRVPWGWSSNLTWVEVEPDGNVRSGPGARLASESSPGMSLAAIPPFSIV